MRWKIVIFLQRGLMRIPWVFSVCIILSHWHPLCLMLMDKMAPEAIISIGYLARHPPLLENAPPVRSPKQMLGRESGRIFNFAPYLQN